MEAAHLRTAPPGHICEGVQGMSESKQSLEFSDNLLSENIIARRVVKFFNEESACPLCAGDKSHPARY